MSAESPTFPAADEAVRLQECAKEPIRTPGRIQSYGVLLVVDAITARVTAASANAREWLDRPITDLGSPTLEWCVTSGTHVDPVHVEVLGASYDAVVHHQGDQAIVELEPSVASLEYARTSVIGAIQRTSQLRELDALRAAAADEVRRITGFDRVMLYHFHPDDHGEVVGEALADGLEPYLGLHFPASDIPPQARDLYITKRSRAIVSTTDPGTPIVRADGSAADLDLSLSELRAVSPHHLQYMRNMGQASTVSISLVHDERLVGMITCAHRTERRVPVLLRRALEVLGTQLTLQLESMQVIGQLEHQLQVRERRGALLAPLSAAGDVLASLFEGRDTVRSIVPADGVLARIGGGVRGAGDLPATDRTALLDAIGDEPIATSELPVSHPALGAIMPGFAGLLSVPIGAEGDKLVFVRREIAREVRWLGDLSDSNRDTVLSPRRSFSEWKQSVSGTSAPWGDHAEEAAELGRQLDDVLQRRAAARLAELAVVDPLTGLHNRRYLMDELESGNGAVLFFDLDRFKYVNDYHGHEIGDAVLVVIAERLRAAAREDDAVVRLGGDEFVVLLRAADTAQALEIAARMLATLNAPIQIGELGLVVTASCGVAIPNPDLTPAEVLKRADAAMYRAKRHGAGKVSD